MIINKAYKVELKPNNRQRTLLAQSAGCARFSFNWGLAQRIELYKNEKKSGAFAEAKRTNHPVVIKQWSEGCDHSVEECDIDNLTQYAMPDGSTKTTRSHSY